MWLVVQEAETEMTMEKKWLCMNVCAFHDLNCHEIITVKRPCASLIYNNDVDIDIN